MEYCRLDPRLFKINIFDDEDFNDKIVNKDYKDPNPMKRIIYKFFNDEKPDVKDIEDLEHIDYLPNKQLFYLIPFVIYCLDSIIAGMLTET